VTKAVPYLIAPLIAAVLLLGGATAQAAVPAATSGSGVATCMKKKGFTKSSPGKKAERRAARRVCRRQQARRKSTPRRSAKRSCKGKTAKRKKACTKRRARKR
jgi:hypothetical protein